MYTRGAGPIVLPTVGDTLQLQQAIHAWHTRDAVHAFCDRPELLLLSLDRYSGHRKSFSEVTFHDVAHAPVFGQNLDVTWIPYQAVSAVFILGPPRMQATIARSSKCNRNGISLKMVLKPNLKPYKDHIERTFMLSGSSAKLQRILNQPQ